MSTHADALSRIYAKSLFEMAMASGGETVVGETLDELQQIVESQKDPAMNRFLATGMVAKGRRQSLLEKAFKGKVGDLTLRFLMVLNDNDRLPHLPSVVNALVEVVEEHRGRMAVEVITAGPLGDDQMRMLKERIQSVLGREPIMHQSVDPNMIGGLKIKVGDRLIDGSVAGRLRRMKHALLTEGDAAIRQRAEAITM